MSGRRAWAETGWLALGLIALLAVSLWVAQKTSAHLLTNSDYDSYTLQALAWRSGRIALDRDYPWLELAVYRGAYYVSFPPVPAVPMWLLTFAFGADVPSGLVTLAYFVLAFIVLYALALRRLPAPQAMLLALFAHLGGSLLDLAVSGNGFSGGVWYQAQLLGLLLTALAFFGLDGDSPGGWAWGLVAVALAVGCRPFNAVYVPALLWMLALRLGRGTLRRTAWAMLPYVAVPALIAVAYGMYNHARFGNPFEFGHAYLPELAQAGEGMFVLSRLGRNLGNIMQPPQVVRGMLLFPTIGGFAFYLTNPTLLLGTGRTLQRAARGRSHGIDAILLLTALAHGALLLTHRTGGGWQYGTRYLCDLIPAMVYLSARRGERTRPWEACLFGALMLFNIFGTIVFHTL